MRAHCLQHVPFEGPGAIGDWLMARGAVLTLSRLDLPEPCWPQLDDFDLLVVMGGPMSVNDEAVLPWLVREKALIREAIEAGKAVLGVCLGAQLMASSLGARVGPAAEKEIGWFPVAAAPLLPPGAFKFPSSVTVFHWHGETFDLPHGAVRLAGSEVCENQAFQLGERVIGLQFHLETTPESAAELVRHCGHELVDGPWVQDARTLLEGREAQYAQIRALLGQVLGYLLRN